jgi:tetratricopeptide (TPR) repeat protein
MTTRARLPWRVLLVLVLALLAWRITALGVARIHLADLDERGEAAARQVLDWYPGQAAALFRLGVGVIGKDAAAAEALLVESYRRNPTDPAPLLVLAGIAQAGGDQARADHLVGRVDALRPSDARVQRDLGRYWLERGRPELAFQHWSRALEANPGMARGLFEIFRELLKDPAMTQAFVELTREPPGWWEGFFTDTAKQARDVGLPRRLYRLRREALGAPLTLAERQAYFERLMREGLIEEAYLVWVNSLTAPRRQHLGLLFNGDFELPLGGVGFEWRAEPADRVRIERSRPEGENVNALQVRFRLLRTPFKHLSQMLLLGPGAYAMAGQSLGQDLITEGGFRWVVRCVAPEQTLLGESERLFGAEAWTPFSFEFEVPASCQYQEVRLVSADGGMRESLTDGELWFDKLSIRRIDALSALGRGKLEASRVEEASVVEQEGAQAKERPAAGPDAGLSR